MNVDSGPADKHSAVMHHLRISRPHFGRDDPHVFRKVHLDQNVLVVDRAVAGTLKSFGISMIMSGLMFHPSWKVIGAGLSLASPSTRRRRPRR